MDVQHNMGGDKSPARWEWLVLAVILIIGVALRIAYYQELAASPSFTHLIYDPQYHDYWARGLVTGCWDLPPGVNDPQIRTTPHGRPPGYPWFLAGVYWVFGVHYAAPRLVQMGLGLLNTLLVFALGRAVFGPVTALIGSLLASTYWGFIYFEGQISYPSVAITLLLLMMLLLRRWRRRPTAAHALLAGILLGVFALFRPNGLLFAPAVLLWMLWLTRRTPEAKMPVRRWFLSAIGLAIGVVVMLTPAMIRNYLVARDFVFLSSFGGLNFYVGNNPESTGVEPRIPELRELAGIDNWSCFDYPTIVTGLARKLNKPGLKHSEASAYFYQKAFEYIRSQPADFLWKTARKALLFWGPREVTNDSMPEIDKRASRVLTPLPGFALVLSLAVLGLLALRLEQRLGAPPANRPEAMLFLAFILAYFFSVLPFFIAGRYRVPILPFLLLFAAHGVAVTVLAFMRGRARAGSGMVALALLLLALFTRNPTGYEPSESTWHFRRGLAFARAGEYENAEQSYRAAVAVGQADAAAYNNLSRLLSRKSDIPAALEVLDAGIKRFPTNADLHNSKGVLLLGEDRLDEAIAAFRQVIEARPDDVSALLNLGEACVRARAWRDAAAWFRRAAETMPDHRDAWNGLGFALHQMGEVGEAEQAYRHALDLDPAYSRARLNLSDLLLSVGRAQEAARELMAAIEKDPNDPYAYNRLGLLLEQAGKTEDALTCYRKALELKPDYAEAQNNVGYMLFRKGLLDEATRHLQEAVRLDPSLRQALVNLGDALAAAGRHAEALKHYQAALELAPENEELRARVEAARAQSEGPEN